jgi:hypothetical protein
MLEMIISEAIGVLEAAFDMFGDIEVSFLEPIKPGDKSKIEFENVDSVAHMNRFFPETGFDENRLSSQN